MINNKILTIVGFSFFLAFICNGIYYLNFGILPEFLFHNNPFDLFMDFFNTNYHAFLPGRYTIWHSIYPPLSFVIGQLVTPSECAEALRIKLLPSVWFRNCAINSYYYFFIPLYLLSVYYTYKLNLQFLDRKNLLSSTRLSIILIAALNSPMLFLLERGNYLILAYLIFILFIYYKNDILKTIFAGLLVNLKPYLVVFLGYELFKKNYILFIYYFLSVLLIFFLTFDYLSDDSALLFIKNMFLFNTTEHVNPSGINFTNSFESYLRLFKILTNLDIGYIFNVFRLFVISLFAYFVFNKSFDKYRYMIVSTLCMLVLTDSVGFYFYVFLLPFVCYFLREKLYIFMMVIYIILPFDLMLVSKVMGLMTIFNEFFQYGGSIPSGAVMNENNVILSLGFFIKPFITFLIYIYFIFSGNSHEQKTD